MKKKLIGFLMCFMLICTSLLAGCSIVEPDYGKYYNQVISVVENTKTNQSAVITKKELISAYQSYGYNYEQYYGMTREEAIDETITLLQNRKITLLTAEKEFGVSEQGKNGLTEKEQTYLYQQVVDSLNENLETYYTSIIGEDEEETEEETITFEGYTKNATLVVENGKYSIKKENVSKDPLANFTYTTARNYFNKEDFDLIYSNFRDYVLNANQDYKDAFKEYVRQIKISEYGQGLSEDTPSMFEREIERLYNVAYETYMIEKYSYSNKNLDEISSISVNDILSLYNNKVRKSYTQYVIEQDSSYDDNMQSSLNDIYYYRTDSEATKFFTVANILFKFTDEQQAKFDEINSIDVGEGGITQAEKDEKLNQIYSSIKPVVRECDEESGNYIEIESDMSLEDVCKEIYTALYNAQNSGNVNNVGDVINNFIYKYNEDTGMFNADSNYVIGVKDGEVVSSFVDSFNDASIDLYKNGSGKIGDSVLNTKDGNYTSSLVRSEYGLHLIIYTGACENLFDTLNVSDENAIETLNSIRVNLLVDKTYFDVLYDEIYQDNYSYYESTNLNFLRQDYKITIYSNRYSDLLD